MTPQADPFVRRVNWLRVLEAGLAAGLFINIFEYVGHRVLLNDAWTAAFRALGKRPQAGERSSLQISWWGC